jgi:hypothetical protein
MALARMATHGLPLRLVRSALASCERVCVAAVQNGMAASETIPEAAN